METAKHWRFQQGEKDGDPWARPPEPLDTDLHVAMATGC